MVRFPAYWCHCSANGGNPHHINTKAKENDVTDTLSLAWVRDVPTIHDRHVLKVDKSQQQRMRIIPVHVITGVVALLACKTDWYVVSKNI